MSDIFQSILMGIAVLCILFLSVAGLVDIKEHKNDHKIHFQIKEISEKEKLEIQILREQLRKIREVTAEP